MYLRLLVSHQDWENLLLKIILGSRFVRTMRLFLRRAAQKRRIIKMNNSDLPYTISRTTQMARNTGTTVASPSSKNQRVSFSMTYVRAGERRAGVRSY